MLKQAVKPSASWYNTVIREHGKTYRTMRNRLHPKNDFILQRLFGEEETKAALISLLNAILRLTGTTGWPT
ncbi:MAG TPA: PD-(D/E)XK nuclease family transposase [Bacilli bacterium]